VISGLVRRERALLQKLGSRIDVTDRFIDFSVELRVVAQDDEGEQLVMGAPDLRVVATHRLGGVVDTKHRLFTGEYSSTPKIWHCGERHARYILHGDDLPEQLLIFGGEGAGKTRGILGMWLYQRAFARVRERLAHHWGVVYMGATAPTQPRLARVVEALESVSRPSWYRWRSKKPDFELACGVTFQLRSTAKRSEREGSPIQGYNWPDAAS